MNDLTFHYLLFDVFSELYFALFVVFVFLGERRVPLSEVVEDLEAFPEPVTVPQELQETNGIVDFDARVRGLFD